MIRFVFMLAAASPSLLVAPAGFTLQAEAPPFRKEALRIADFLVALQDAQGAIPDSPGSEVCNVDSNMEYALIGLAHAYAASRERRYLSALEKGLRWLAEREEMADPRWKGSWFYAYDARPPYAPRPTSPGEGVEDVRGVDATSALFVYLLRLHAELAGTNALAVQLADHARAALDFLLERNRAADGFFYNSWQKKKGEWVLWKYQYAADQADVYLGLAAGAKLYDRSERRYRKAALFLKDNVRKTFFDSRRGRFATGRDEAGAPDLTLDGFNGVFPQGYLPWVWGASDESRAAYQWLLSGQRSDGRLLFAPDDPSYSLSAAILGAAAAALGAPPPKVALERLISTALDSRDGGVRDTGAGSEKLTNVAGFSVIGLLGSAPIGAALEP